MERPGDLPVQRLTKVEMIINFKAAKALGISVPLPLLGRADEVIEQRWVAQHLTHLRHGRTP
jgi:putative ABC transport system substrate-binding protein